MENNEYNTSTEVERYLQACERERKVYTEKERVDWGTSDIFPHDFITPRYAQYALRGVPVTPEQAIDIITKLDGLFNVNSWDKKSCRAKWQPYLGSDRVGFIHFNVDNFSEYFKTWSQTWIHPDGRIGFNGQTSRIPFFDELLDECISIAKAFPYLEIIIVSTYWEESCNETLILYPKDGESWDDVENISVPARIKRNSSEFLDQVEVGLYIKDGIVHVLNVDDSVAKFKEICSKYAHEETDDYFMNYHYSFKDNLELFFECGRRRGIPYQLLMEYYQERTAKPKKLRQKSK